MGWAGQGWECPARGPSWCWVEAALEEVLEAQVQAVGMEVLVDS